MDKPQRSARAGRSQRRPQQSDRARDKPTLRLLSLGAGVQSLTVLLLACEGRIPRFDHALFADTGWEPRAVHNQLAKVTAIATRAGTPVRIISAGNIRHDALDATSRFVTMPLHVRNPDGSKGMARRQCTGEYKIKPLKAAARQLLGYPHPTRVPPGVYAEQAIGISVDEFHRAKDADVRYLRNIFPLLDLRMTREDCLAYLRARGFGETVKSACVGCPYSGNSRLRWIRDNEPDAWTDLIAFDRAIRNGSPRAIAEGKPLRGQFFIHRSLKPLDQVDLDPPARGHLRLVGGTVSEEDDPDGCSPWSCRSGESVDTSSVGQAA
jgi:3'-phosphoadenosine 5'-phosphosulfate sulfotransferase (PAPS reductase)/FAD synthetase